MRIRYVPAIFDVDSTIKVSGRLTAVSRHVASALRWKHVPIPTQVEVDCRANPPVGQEVPTDRIGR